jgi:hypothetical protein
LRRSALEDEYAGTRATLPARCGKARLSLQIAMGLADAVWPAPESCVYPTLLDFPAPELLAYPREAVVAEKFEAMVVLGDRNSRIKDFFNLHHLATRFEFDRATLTEAVRRTFERRRTPLPEESDGFADECARLLGGFLAPVLGDLRTGRTPACTWRPGGPWQ